MSKKISLEEFINRIQIRYPNEHFEIIEYTTVSNPLKVKCLSCNKVLSYPQAKNFLAKNKKVGCNECAGLKAKNNINLKKIQEKYVILKTQKDSTGKTWYTCECKMCHRIATHTLTSFLNNTCRCEGPGNYYTENEFKTKLFNEYNNEYILLSPFKGVNTKSLFKHSCGFIWSTTPAHILYNKTRCPKCCHKESKACKYISKCLDRLNISYEKEKFLNNSLQRFDFYFEYNNIKYAIEYNGEQHYKYNPFFHGNDINTFYKYQERDERKKQYCLDNDIILIIIPYTFSNNDIQTYINKLFISSTTIP